MAVLLSCATALLAGGTPAQAATQLSKPTVVSLTFDDSDADQVGAEQTLVGAGLVGTFYTVDGWVGAPDYLTRSNLTTFAADGNEIAGHTVTHQDLIEIDPSEAQRQICDDRATLANWGFQPVDFAYPFSDANAQVEALAKGCGYNTARGLGDVRSPGSCQNCVYAETTPPPHPYYLRAPDQVDSTWTAAMIEKEVTQAVAHHGGWVILTFHHVCADIGADDCQADQSTTPATFDAFIAWLAGYVENGANNTTVKTVDQEVRAYSGANYPGYVIPHAIPSPPPAPVGVNALTDPSLETTDKFTDFPTCFQPGGWGTNTAVWASSTAAHSGTAAEQLGISGYSSGDAKLLPTLDLGSCSPSVIAGQTYDLSTWYFSTGLTQFALYYRDATGAWYYWTSSPYFAAASSYTQATWASPPVPANAVAMSFGLALISNGTLTTDDYSLVDPGTAGAPAATPAATSTAPLANLGGTGARGLTRIQRTAPSPLIPGGRSTRPGTRLAVPEVSHPGGC